MPPLYTIAFAFSLCLFLFASDASARPGPEEWPKCGERVDVSDVLVIDTENESAETSEKLELIKTARMNERTWPFKNRGSRVQTVRSATRWAAGQGCNVLVIGPMTDVDLRTYGGMGTMDTSGGQGVELRKYLSVRVGVRDGND